MVEEWSYAFPRPARLKRRRLIRQLFEGRSAGTSSVSCGSIRILYRLEERSSENISTPVQTGFAVGRSAGGAVVRNRIKRVMRDSFRHSQNALKIPMTDSRYMLAQMILYRGAAVQEIRIREDLKSAIEKLANRLATDSLNGDAS
jgi:ribonuclease P protein component